MANERRTQAEMIDIQVGTILSMRTKEGIVEMQIADSHHTIFTQLDIRKAKEVRDMLSEAIEAAISDTLIFKYLTEVVGTEEDKAAGALMHFREIRQGLRGTVYPS